MPGTKHISSPDPPLLAAEGVLRVLRCELVEDKGLVEVGDHVIVLGNVVSIIEPSNAQSETAEQRGLCYLDRAYREVGNIIEVPDQEPEEV
jgi:flavin reductase (DIM6/NTAB) family NADH-FMN oxidoreductase RutF